MNQTRSFAHAPQSVTSARRFATETLQNAPAEALDAIALMVSELASNCIRHTNAGFELTINHTEDEIRIEATDDEAREPRMRTPGPEDPDGRGLQIIDMLATRWGVERLPGAGKTVWFMMRLAPLEASRHRLS